MRRCIQIKMTMKRILVVLIFAIGMTLGTFQASAQNSAYTNFCTSGSRNATTSGLNSSNLLLSAYTFCTVSVYATGTTNLIPLFSNATGTTLSNPFNASAVTGQYLFYGATGTVVDVTMSAGFPSPGIVTPLTLTGITLGGGGGGGMVYPGAGVPVSSGSSWLTSLGIQGTDTNVLTSSTISGTGSALCTDANGGATTVGCLSGTLGGSVSPYFTPYSNAVNQLVNSPDFWDPTGAAQHNFVTTVKEIHQTPETDFIGTGGSAGSIGLKQGTTLAASNNEVQLSAPTSVTAYNFNFPGAQWNGCLFDDGAGNGSGVPCGGNFAPAITPTGNYVAIYPTTETTSSAGCTSASGFADGTAASSAIFGAGILSACGVGGRAASVTFGGFFLPTWLPSGNVVSVACYTVGNYTQGGGGQVLDDVQSCGPSSPFTTTVFLNSSVPFTTRQSSPTGATSTITGSTITTAGIVTGGTGSTCGQPGCGAPAFLTNQVVATPFLLVAFSGVSAPSPSTTTVNPPIIYNSSGLSIDLTWPFPGEWLNPTTEALAIGSTGASTVGTIFNIIDSTVTSGCITGGGGNQVFGVWNGSCIAVFGFGGSTAFQVNGTPLTSAATVNFENSAATDGVTLSFSNPSAGNVQLAFSGILTPAGGGTGVATAPTSAQLLVGQSGGVYAPETASGSCTVTSGGVFTCTGGAIPGFGTQTVDVENTYSGANAGAKLIACLADGTLKPGTICDMRGITSEATQPVSLGTAPIEVGRSGPQSVLWPSCDGPTNSFCGAVVQTASTTLATPSAPTISCSTTGGNYHSAGVTFFAKVNYRTGDAVSASSTEVSCTLASTTTGSVTVTGPASCPTYTSEYDVTLSLTTGTETLQMNQACGVAAVFTNQDLFPISSAAPSAATPLPAFIIHNNKSQFYSLFTGQTGFPFYTTGSTVATDMLATTDNGYSGISNIFLYNNGGGTIAHGMADNGVYAGSIRDHIWISAGSVNGMNIFGQVNDVTYNLPSFACSSNSCDPLSISWWPQTVGDGESLATLNFNGMLISTKANASNTGNGIRITGRPSTGSTFWESVGSGVEGININGASLEMGASAANGILATDFTGLNINGTKITRASFGGTAAVNINQTWNHSGQPYQSGNVSIDSASHIESFTDVVLNNVSTDPLATIAGTSGVSFDVPYKWGGGTSSLSSPDYSYSILDQPVVFGAAAPVTLGNIASGKLVGTTTGGLTQGITLGTNLSFSGTTLNATAGGGGDTITSPSSTLTVGGTSTNTTLDINLANANTWTAKQSFGGGDLFFGGVNVQTSTSYTIVAADENQVLTVANVSAVAVTLPQATTTGFTSGAVFDVINLGAGTATITPTTSTINGATTLVLQTGQSARISSNGTNYFAELGTSSTSGFIVTVPTSSSTNVINSSTNNVIGLTILGSTSSVDMLDVGQVGNPVGNALAVHANETVSVGSGQAWTFGFNGLVWPQGAGEFIEGGGISFWQPTNVAEIDPEGQTRIFSDINNGNATAGILIAPAYLQGNGNYGDTVNIIEDFYGGTIANTGDLVAFVGGGASYQMNDCAISCINGYGILTAINGHDASVQSRGKVVVNLDASSTIAVGDNICSSAITAGLLHANGTTPCATQRVGFVGIAATTVTTATIVLK